MIDVHLLGEMRLRVGRQWVDPGPRQQRTVLAALLVDAGCPVPVEVLVTRVWGDEAPQGSRKVLHVQLSRIRRLLQEAGAELPPAQAPSVDRLAGGYRITVPAERVDLFRFRALLAQAQDQYELTGRRRALEEALRLWTGTPLTGLTGRWVERVRARARQERLEAVVQWAGIAAGGGGAEETLVRLAGLEEEYPLAEPLAAARMRLLATHGRPAEALECFARLRRCLVEQLGTQPGPELLDLHTAILRGEPVPGTVLVTSRAGGEAGTGATDRSLDGNRAMECPVARTPAQLPGDVRAFTGRERELRVLDGWAEEARVAGRSLLLAVVGMVGVGKTALAVHWGHRVTADYPGGQVYVDLRGDPAGGPLSGSAVVAAVLRAVGVPGESIPADLTAGSGLLRSLLAERRVLVVLDGATCVDQVRPLRPGAGGSVVLVTARDALPGLVIRDGARRLELDVLPDDEADELVRALLGGRPDPGAVAGGPLARCCGHLPLAVRLGIEYAHAQGYCSADEIAAALECPDVRRDVLGAAVAARLGPLHGVLEPETHRCLRVAATLPESGWSTDELAVVAGIPSRRARELLDTLITGQFLRRARGETCVMHPLLRLAVAALEPV